MTLKEFIKQTLQELPEDWGEMYIVQETEDLLIYRYSHGRGKPLAAAFVSMQHQGVRKFLRNGHMYKIWLDASAGQERKPRPRD